ncbi:hypothetical protein PRZ48_003610 [Zasmidium cellare]|uniref:Uncharacterized protein n=1 Tax=Zasmidium cellare TaxID=395010 RepID=A0ABR0EWK0_ZASCE|nr:hypothetical protein PRZ48_003610 [Zasmidium cellare]
MFPLWPFEREAPNAEAGFHLLEENVFMYIGKSRSVDDETDEAEKASRMPWLMDLHHLVWCIGVQCGIRPESLFKSSKDTGEDANDPEDSDEKTGDEDEATETTQAYETLRWRNVTITRRKDGFMAKVIFTRIKGRNGKVYPGVRKFPTMYFRTSKDPNLFMMSMPDRMLMELLAHDLLIHHTSLDSLPNGDDNEIQIKSKANDLPVFYGLGGLGTHLQGPTINQHLQQREALFGLPPHHTLYSFRAYVGTEFERLYGEVDAQKTLGHKPHGETFYRHYDLGIDHIDFVGAILEHRANEFRHGTAILPATVYRDDKTRLAEEYKRKAKGLRYSQVEDRTSRLGSSGIAAQGKRTFLRQLLDIIEIGNGKSMEASYGFVDSMWTRLLDSSDESRRPGGSTFSDPSRRGATSIGPNNGSSAESYGGAGSVDSRGGAGSTNSRGGAGPANSRGDADSTDSNDEDDVDVTSCTLAEAWSDEYGLSSDDDEAEERETPPEARGMSRHLEEISGLCAHDTHDNMDLDEVSEDDDGATSSRAVNTAIEDSGFKGMRWSK